MKLIPLSKTGKNKGLHFAMVDDEDYEWLNQWRWCVTKHFNTFYARRTCYKNKKRVHILMHRLILCPQDNKITDHVDRNGLNCQRINLRPATHSQNSCNKTSKMGCTSQYHGVWRSSKYSNRWEARIYINGKRFYCGSSYNEMDAAKKYDIMARLHHGEFASLNFK